MKKLLIIGCFILSHVNMHALESALTKQKSYTMGQLCGNDNCGCQEPKRPEINA